MKKISHGRHALPRKKLTLDKQTLRTLASMDLGQVAGGKLPTSRQCPPPIFEWDGSGDRW